MDKIVRWLLVWMVLCGVAHAQPLTGLGQATLPLSGNELAYIVQGGVSKQAPVNSFYSASTCSLVSGCTFTGAVSFGATGTGLAVTNNATVGGTLGVTGATTLGNGSANYWTFSGASGSPTIAATGSGNQFAQIKGLGQFGPLMQSSSGGNIMAFESGATSSTNFATLTVPTTTGHPINLTVSDNTGGFQFGSPLLVQYNWTYNGTATSTFNHPLNLGGSSITGTSANTSQYAINQITNNYSNFFSGQGTFGLQIQGLVAAGSIVRTNVPLYVAATQSGQPATPTAWASGQTISIIGTLRTNAGKLYQATNTGTTASSGPTCGSGTCTDGGGVTWQWDDAASNSNYAVAEGILASTNYNVGGTSSAPVGMNFALTIGCALQTGSTFYNENVCMEYDDDIQTGSSVVRDATAQFVKEGLEGTVQDWGASFSGTNAPSYWRNPIILQSATDPNGVGIEFADQGVGGLQTMAGAIDALMVSATGANTVSGAAVTGGGGYILRAPNSQLLGTGDLQLGSVGFHITSQTLTIDTTYEVLASVGAVSGGTGWPTSGQLAVDDFGNVASVTASSGVPSSISITGQPKTYVAAASVPGGTVTWHAMNSTGAFLSATGSGTLPTNFTTASETYTPGTTILIGPTSASLIRIGGSSGDVVFGSGANFGSLGATAGFAHLPFTNATSGSGGIPTGTPANTSGPACVWNDVTFVLDCYSPSAGAWKHVAFSSNAG